MDSNSYDAWMVDDRPALSLPRFPRLPELGEIDGPSFVYEDDYGLAEADAAWWPTMRTPRAAARQKALADFDPAAEDEILLELYGPEAICGGL